MPLESAGVWYREHLVYTIVDFGPLNSWTSRYRLIHHGSHEASLPFGFAIAETWRGVYVTTLPPRPFHKDGEILALGQDRVCVTQSSMRHDEGMEYRRGRSSSWATQYWIWFSLEYHPKPLTLTFLRHWECMGTNWIDNDNLLRQHDRTLHLSGIVPSLSTSQLSPSNDIEPAALLPGRCNNCPQVTAADIPQELFGSIISYIGDERTLATSTLVCVNWAQACRKRLYTERTWAVKSSFRLRALDCLTTTESQRLVPLRALVTELVFRQTWNARSWIHHIHNSHFDRHSNALYLTGPVPSSLPASALRSPHWSLPRTMPSCFLNFSHLSLRQVHFPALSDFALLVRHFTRSKVFCFDEVTWDVGDVVVPSPRCRVTHAVNLVICCSSCTTQARLLKVQTRLMLDSDSLLFCRLSAYEQDACVRVFSSLASCVDKPHREKLARFFQLTQHREPNHIKSYLKAKSAAGPAAIVDELDLRFYCDWASGAPIIKAAGLRVFAHDHVCFERIARHYQIVHTELHSARLPSLSTVLFKFSSLDELRAVFAVYPGLCAFVNSESEKHVGLRFVCSRFGLGEYLVRRSTVLSTESDWKWATIDPISLLPTGETWGLDVDADVEARLGLQRNPRCEHW